MHLLLAAKLAWKNSTNDPKRLIIRCAGITFAVVLMFMQTGFRNALFDSNVRAIEMIDCDIIIKNESRYTLSSGQSLQFDELLRSSGHVSVVDSQPLYIEVAGGLLRQQGKKARKIRVIGANPESPMFASYGVNELSSQLLQPGTAIADTKSKRMFKLNENSIRLQGESFGELAEKKIDLVGSFQLGIDFSNDGNLFMSPENFNRYFSYRGRGGEASRVIDYGLLKCEPGTNVKIAAREIQSLVGKHTRVLTKQKFLAAERSFWGKNTPIGLIFMVGTIIGFVVGMIICYQVLASDISDHLGEFATLKAMGYKPSFFASVVVFQALCLSLFSFLPGLLITLIAFQFINSITGLLMFLNFARGSVVLFLTVAMCVASGFIALRRLLTADPASLF
jgi:putative ABC transport system permease protein